MTTAIVTEDGAFSVMARVDLDGAVASFLQASLTSITWKVYDVTDLSTAFATGSATISTDVFDTLQTDGRWSTVTGDTTGYNFKYEFAATVFTTPGRYRLEFLVIPSAGAGSQFFIVDKDTREPPVIQVGPMATS